MSGQEGHEISRQGGHKRTGPGRLGCSGLVDGVWSVYQRAWTLLVCGDREIR